MPDDPNPPPVRIINARFSANIGGSGSGSSTGAAGSGRLRPSPFAQGFTLLAAAILLILLIPLAIIGIVLAIIGGLAAIAYITARRTLTRLRAPNGALDGRKNVRVRMPNRDTDAAA